MKTVLITGVSGFLGSNIAKDLIAKNFQVIALKRSTSNLQRCISFSKQVKWIDCNNITDAEAEIRNCKPEILIHAAWGGVKAYERDNWVKQEKNLSFMTSLLEIIKKTEIKKIISLGSQAEYGNFEGFIDESHPCHPNNAYGANKVCASFILKTFAEQNDMDWYWIRLFSVFGPGEDKNWLIPYTIENLLNKKNTAFTPCEQEYDYLYIEDFTSGIIKIIKDESHSSGLYNMSSGQSIKLKDILCFLENIISPNEKLLQFGALPYRPNQVMHLQGNSDYFFNTFHFRPQVDVFAGLEKTVNYYKDQKNNE